MEDQPGLTTHTFSDVDPFINWSVNELTTTGPSTRLPTDTSPYTATSPFTGVSTDKPVSTRLPHTYPKELAAPLHPSDLTSAQRTDRNLSRLQAGEGHHLRAVDRQAQATPIKESPQRLNFG
jgi:hypothetical protein